LALISGRCLCQLSSIGGDSKALGIYLATSATSWNVGFTTWRRHNVGGEGRPYSSPNPDKIPKLSSKRL